MISLEKLNTSCNVVVDLSARTCASSETKDGNVKAFNMIINKNEAKTMAKNIPYDCEWKFNSTACNSNQIWHNKTC